MAIAFVGIGTPSHAATTTSPAFHGGYSQTSGDVAVYIVDVGGTNTPPDTPAGWAVAGAVNAGPFTGGLYGFVKVLNGSDTVPSITRSGADRICGVVEVYSGADGTTPQDATAVTSTGSHPFTPTGITTVTNGAVVISTTFTNFDVLSVGTANGFTNRLLHSNASPAHHSTGIGDITKATAGAQTCPTWNSDSDPHYGVTIALRPAGAASGKAPPLRSRRIPPILMRK